jgi:hypothetical protein
MHVHVLAIQQQIDGMVNPLLLSYRCMQAEPLAVLLSLTLD